MEFIKRFGIFLSLLHLIHGKLDDCRASLRVPINSRISLEQSSTIDANQSDIIRKEYKLVCDEGYELFGNSDLSCSTSSKTSIGFCAANVSPNRPSNFSSQAVKQSAGGGGVLNDGDVTSCASTQKELNPYWKADLLQVYEVTGIRIHGYNATNISVQDDATGLDLEIRVGNNPISQKNPLCAWKPGTGGGDLGATEYHSCARPIQGRFVSIQIIGEGILSMCEVSVFATDAIPLQRCRPDGQEKVVNFNGTCFEFAIKNSGKSMQDARSQCVARGGDLASEQQLIPTSPSLNLITSILEDLKSNVKRPLFWIGVERDPGFTSRSWRWIGPQTLVKKPNWGKDQPNNYNGEQNCAVLDGGKDWQWNDVGCALDYFHWICVFPPRVCGSPDRIEGTEFSNESKEYLVGFQMYYNCSSKGHFVASGSSLRTCLRSGFWSGQAPKCRFVDCGPEPLFVNVPNGKVFSATNETFYGASLSYSCDDGYTLVGDSARTCQKDGKWSGSGSTKCLLSTCQPPPEIVNGTFISTGLKHGSTITYKCHSGHILIGSNVLTCKLGGTYDNSPPICKFIQCDELPTIPNGHYKLANSSTVLNSIAQVECEENYEPSELVDVYLECRENGRWEGQNQKRIGISKSRHTSEEGEDLSGCILITCLEPEVPHGTYVTGYGFTVGSEIQYHCEDGYKMHGASATRMCDKHGQWTGAPPRCEYVDCGRATAILHGHLSYPNSTTHLGSEVHYSCAQNYKIKPGSGKHSIIDASESASRRTCLSNGLWSGATPSCEEVRCGVPPLPPATVASVSKNDRYNVHQSLLTFSTMPSDVNVTYKIGTVLKYRCERGYILRGGNLKTCLENGEWSENELEDKLECIFVDCGDPPELANGLLKLTSNATYYGTTAIYECNKGYKLIGNSRRQCLENSTWSGNFDPHCREITCDAPEKFNTSIDIKSFQIGGIAKYSCGKGMNLIGNGTRHCTEHGVWSGDPPICQFVTCPDPPIGDNVRVFQLNGSRYTSVVEYHCVHGYEMTRKSISILMCSENGAWSPPYAPTCISKDTDYATNFIENSQSPNANTAEESSSLAVILGLSFGFIIIALVVGLLLWIRKSKMKTRSSSSNGKATRASVPKDQPMVIFPSPGSNTNQTQSHYYDNPSVDPIYENLDDYGVTSNSSVVGSASVVTINGVSIT